MASMPGESENHYSAVHLRSFLRRRCRTGGCRRDWSHRLPDNRWRRVPPTRLRITARGRIVADARRRPIELVAEKLAHLSPRTIHARLPDRETGLSPYLPHSKRTAAANFTTVIMWLVLLVGLL